MRWGRLLLTTGSLTVALLATLFGFALVGRLTGGAAEPTAQGPQFVFWELNGETTTFWIASAGDPSSRRAIATLSHRQGYGPRAALSPDGSYLALTLLPAAAVDTGADAGLWVVEVNSGSARLLANGIDLRQAPRWADNSQEVSFRRVTTLPEGGGRRFEVLKSALSRGGEPTVIANAASGDVQNLSPVGWTADGRSVLLVRLGGQGTEIWEAADGGLRLVARVSEGLAQEFLRSPDARRLAFVRPGAQGSAASLETLDLNERTVRRVVSNSQAIFSPVWSANGSDLAYGVANSAERRRSPVERAHADGVVVAPLPPPSADGFDIPLAWSADGRSLALRSIQGLSPSQVTAESLVILEASSGLRLLVVAGGHVQFVAWLP